MPLTAVSRNGTIACDRWIGHRANRSRRSLRQRYRQSSYESVTYLEMQFSRGEDDVLSGFLDNVFGTWICLVQDLQPFDQFRHITYVSARTICHTAKTY